MAYQQSVTVRNAMLDAIETANGVSAVFRIRTGLPPATCATADSGTVLASIALASDWMSNAASGSKAIIGTPNVNASATGTAGHFRIYDTAGTTCHQQGTVTLTGGGGDMTVDNTSLASGQLFTITGFTITAGNS